MALGTDIRHAWRGYARSPLLTATLVLTVAVGTGGSAAIFAFIGGLVTHDAPTPDPADAARFARVAVLLFVASGFVLLLASATVAGLLLSRSSARMLETAVKIAIGATRRRLARQCLVDTLIVTLVGGAIGVVLAWWTSRLFPLLFFADDARHLALAPDPVWLGVTAAVWIVVMLFCGMAPVLAVPERDPSLVLRRDASRSSNFSRRFRMRLVAGQIALCSILVIVAGVIREDLAATIRSSRGQVVGSLLVAPIAADGGPTADGAGSQYFRAVEKTARATAGVTQAGWIRNLPGGISASQEFSIERPTKIWREIRLDVATFAPEALPPDRLRASSGRLFGGRDLFGACRVAIVNQEAADRYFGGAAAGRSLEDAGGRRLQIAGVLASLPNQAAERPTLFYYDVQEPAREGVERDALFRGPEIAPRASAEVDVNVASPEYFDLFSDPPVAGRAFDATDGSGRCRVAVINELGARTLFDGAAVGGAIIDALGDRIDIVGVVRADALGAARRAPAPAVVLPMAQTYLPAMTLAVRAPDASERVRSVLDQDLRKMAGGTVRSSVATLEDHLQRTSLAAARIATTLVGVCAALALALSLAGVYAVMADLVARRRRELALRIALGAGGWQVVGSVVGEGLRLAATGGGVGLVLAVATTPLLEHFVVRPRLPGPVVLATATCALGVLVTLACALPAWRAVHVDPRGLIHDE